MPSSLTEVKDKIFSVGPDTFDDLALEVFRLQARYNPVYGQYLRYLHIKPDEVKKVAQIPFLPISLFKQHQIVTGDGEARLIFESSGTTGTDTSRHYVLDEQMYIQSLSSAFDRFFGDSSSYVYFALLPSYLERQNSSLVYMVNYLMQQSREAGNGFYLYEHEKLFDALKAAKAAGQKVFFIGVSYALLDFADAYPIDLSGAVIMETGGMKGRRKEIIRPELHAVLKEKFNVRQIVSEYGMTELLSQAYALENGIFETPPWMRVMMREPNDPFSYVETGQTGGINVIDLANLYSCSFIATQDLGVAHTDDSFEVLGRFDHSDIRGCSLLYS
jgi:phenylacetate-coenzyme A ligase PaaK-like adenylate-forming protein